EPSVVASVANDPATDESKAKPKKEKAEGKGKDEKETETKDKPLSDRQVRILKSLLKAGKPLKGKQLAAAAQIDPTSIGNQAGYRDPEINEREVHRFNLLNRGYVKLTQENIEGRERFVYSITAAGKKALAKTEAK